MDKTGKKIAAVAVGAATALTIGLVRMWLIKRPRKIEVWTGF